LCCQIINLIWITLSSSSYKTSVFWQFDSQTNVVTLCLAYLWLGKHSLFVRQIRPGPYNSTHKALLNTQNISSYTGYLVFIRFSFSVCCRPIRSCRCVIRPHQPTKMRLNFSTLKLIYFLQIYAVAYALHYSTQHWRSWGYPKIWPTGCTTPQDLTKLSVIHIELLFICVQCPFKIPVVAQITMSSKKCTIKRFGVGLRPNPLRSQRSTDALTGFREWAPGGEGEKEGREGALVQRYNFEFCNLQQRAKWLTSDMPSPSSECFYVISAFYFRAWQFTIYSSNIC